MEKPTAVVPQGCASSSALSSNGACAAEVVPFNTKMTKCDVVQLEAINLNDKNLIVTTIL